MKYLEQPIMKIPVIVALLPGFSSCSTLKVSRDFDKQSNFAAFKTFAFSDERLTLPIGDLNRDVFINAIETEMAAKGFSKSDNPDVVIDLRIRADERTEASATAMGPPGFHGGYWR